MPASPTNVKVAARRLIDQLPGSATWDDLMEEKYHHQTIEAGKADSEAGRTVDVTEVRARFGLLA